MNAALPRYNVPGLERGLRMLQLFDRNHKLLTAAEMARALAIPRSTAFRLAQTLEFLGFLERDGDRYRVGPAVLRLGFEYIASLEVTELARPLIERLRDATDLSAQLVIRDGREVVVVLKASPSSTFASNVTVVFAPSSSTRIVPFASSGASNCFSVGPAGGGAGRGTANSSRPTPASADSTAPDRLPRRA